MIAVSFNLSLVEAHPISLVCPRCRQRGHFVQVPIKDITWIDTDVIPNLQALAGMRRCPDNNCRTLVFFYKRVGDGLVSLPNSLIDFDTTNIPPKIQASISEALKCHGAGAYRAAALMVRRVLEELCEDRGAQGDSLYKRVEALSAIAVIPKELLEAAHELRLLGNDAAHIEAKTYDEIGKEEVEVAIDLAKELLKAVYQLVSLVERMRSLKREAGAEVKA